MIWEGTKMSWEGTKRHLHIHIVRFPQKPIQLEIDEDDMRLEFPEIQRKLIELNQQELKKGNLKMAKEISVVLQLRDFLRGEGYNFELMNEKENDKHVEETESFTDFKINHAQRAKIDHADENRAFHSRRTSFCCSGTVAKRSDTKKQNII